MVIVAPTLSDEGVVIDEVSLPVVLRGPVVVVVVAAAAADAQLFVEAFVAFVYAVAAAASVEAAVAAVAPWLS